MNYSKEYAIIILLLLFWSNKIKSIRVIILKKSYYIYASLILVILFLSGIIFKDNLFSALINLDVANSKLLIIYMILCIIYFLTPLPVTIIILLNGYLFQVKGLYISLVLLILGSTFLYLFSIKIQSKFNFNFSKILNKKKIDLKKISENNYSIFFSRYIIPYFFHNVYYGLLKTNIVKFIIIIFFAESPMVYALNSLGSSLKNFQLNYAVLDHSLFTDINFYVPFAIIFVIFVLSNFFLKNK